MKVCGIPVPAEVLAIITRQRKWTLRYRTMGGEEEDTATLERVPCRGGGH